MRVLHFLGERGWSGGEVQLRLLVEHLQRCGHDNVLALVPGARFAEVGRELGIAVVETDLRHPLRRSTVQAVRAAVERHRPDLVHFACGRALLWAGWWLRHESGAVKVTTRRIDYPIGRGWLRGGRYRRLVDHVIANCESVRRRVRDAGVPEGRVTLIHEGIEMAPFEGLAARRQVARARLGLPEDALVVACAATLRPRKGQRGLLRAFAGLLPRFPNAVLVLAGSGPDRAALERLARRLGLADRVLLPGRVDPIGDLWAASDLACLASRHEGLANACLEASAAGLPLVVSDAGGLPEIVLDGATGAVVRRGDEEELSLALVRYLADPDLRQRAGVAGAARTRRLFSAQGMVERTEALFAALLARRACSKT